MTNPILPRSNAYCLDCLAALRSLPDQAVSLAIVDPPYGLRATRNGNGSRRKIYDRTEKNAWDDAVPGADFFSELFRVSRNQIIWGGNYFALPPTKGFVIWDKQQPDGMSFASCEYAWTSFQRVAKTFRMRPQNMDEGRIHPCQKPIALYAWLLDHYARPGDTIIDTHMGSQSSRIAAYKKGYDFLGYEISPAYFKAGSDRFDRAVDLPVFFR